VGLYSPIDKLDDWVQGETQAIDWVIYQSNERDLEDITSYTLAFRLATGEGGTVIIDQTVDTIVPEQGVCETIITAAQSLALDDNRYWYELWRTNTGFEERLAHGEAYLRPGITA